MKTGILFDLDGTLWDSSRQVLVSWNETLEKQTGAATRITIEELLPLFGKPIEAIAESLFPELTQKQRMEIIEKCSEGEMEYLRREGGVLYPDLEKTLARLKEKYTLAIISNCPCGYIEVFLERHQLGGYFEDYECCGRTGLSKGENIRLVIERNQLAKAVYIGDTEGDCQAAAQAGIPFIHAAYGFGRTAKKTRSVQAFNELPAYLENSVFFRPDNI